MTRQEDIVTQSISVSINLDKALRQALSSIEELIALDTELLSLAPAEHPAAKDLKQIVTGTREAQELIKSAIEHLEKI